MPGSVEDLMRWHDEGMKEHGRWLARSRRRDVLLIGFLALVFLYGVFLLTVVSSPARVSGHVWFVVAVYTGLTLGLGMVLALSLRNRDRMVTELQRMLDLYRKIAIDHSA